MATTVTIYSEVEFPVLTCDVCLKPVATAMFHRDPGGYLITQGMGETHLLAYGVVLCGDCAGALGFDLRHPYAQAGMSVPMGLN